MIGAEYAQLAKELGLKLEQGVAYGLLQGYPVTFLDGIGCHRLMITTRFATAKEKDDLMDIINEQPLSVVYDVKKLQIAKKVFYVVFRNNPDTPAKIKDFLDWLLPLLPQYSASPATTCIQCGKEISEEELQWVLRDGSVAFVMHRACAEKLRMDLRIDKDRKTSVMKGLGGAAVGALLGAVVWMILQAFGWYASIVGMLVGWLCVTFYHRNGDPKSKLKLPIILLMGVLGVALGTVLGEVPAMIKAGAGWQLFGQFWTNLTTNDDFFTGIMDHFSMGAIMMLMGLFVAYRNQGRKDTVTVTDLGGTNEETDEEE